MYSYHDFMVMKGRGSRPRRPAARRTIPTYHAAIKGEDDRLAAPRLQGYAAPRSLTERYGGKEYWRRVMAAIERQAYAPPEPRTRIGIALAYAIQERQRCAENIANRLASALR